MVSHPCNNARSLPVNLSPTNLKQIYTVPLGTTHIIPLSTLVGSSDVSIPPKKKKKKSSDDKRATKLKSNKIALIIHGPKNVDYDLDIGPVILTDWYHDEYFEIVKRVMSVPVSEWGIHLPTRSCFVLKNETVAATSAFRQQFD